MTQEIKVGDSEYHAWGYAPHATTNDTSVSGWNVMALKSAKCAGLHVDPFSFAGAMAWINTGQDIKDAPKGDAEYWEGGMMAYQGTVGAAPGTHKNMARLHAIWKLRPGAHHRSKIGWQRVDASLHAGYTNFV